MASKSDWWDQKCTVSVCLSKGRAFMAPLCSCFTLLCSTVATFQVLILFSQLCIHMANFSDFVNSKTDSMITFMFPQHAYFGRILTVWINTICLCIVRTSSINNYIREEHFVLQHIVPTLVSYCEEGKIVKKEQLCCKDCCKWHCVSLSRSAISPLCLTVVTHRERNTRQEIKLR